MTQRPWQRPPFRVSYPPARVDRAGHRRTEPELARDLAADPRARAMVVAGGRVATRSNYVAWWPAAAFAIRPPADEPSDELWIFLGEGNQGPRLALVLPAGKDGGFAGDAGTGLADLAGDGEIEFRDLRQVLEGGDETGDLAQQAVALAHWHARARFCPVCGAPTRVASAGWLRVCTAEGTELYPRTDPAVIMSVVDPDDSRILLGHVASWPDRRFSTLAGFVEPAESLEEAVRREVDEEVGVRIGDVIYRGSQPWPFPGSAMVAFEAHATTVDIQVDGIELSEARWFTRRELVLAVGSGEILMPTPVSIARALIENWCGEPLPDR